MIDFPLMCHNSQKENLIIHCSVLGAGIQSLAWIHQIFPSYSQFFLPVSLNIMIGCIFGSSHLLTLDLVIVYLCCFNMILIFVWFILYKLPHDINILMIWLNSIKYIIMNEKYSWSDKVLSGFSGIPIKVHPAFVLNSNCFGQW